MSPLQGPVAVVIDAEQPGFSHYGAGKGVYRCQYSTVQYSTVQYSTVQYSTYTGASTTLASTTRCCWWGTAPPPAWATGGR